MKIENLYEIQPREESGSKTSRKYDYQKNLSLFLLLKFHDKKDDYVFLFDYHDDLIIMDSSINPKHYEFYQIKSKDTKTNWTVNALTKAKHGKLSIIGKLYLNKLNFKNATKSLNFISNAGFNFQKLKNGDESTKRININGKELNQRDVETFDEKIKKEHKLTKKTEFENLANFHVTHLSNQDSSTHCLGELVKLINKINPHNRINSELAYKQVFTEISRKTGQTVGDKNIKSLGELIEIKGITKKEFIDYLEKAGLYKSIEEEWEEIKTSLETNGIGHYELKEFKKNWRSLNATLVKDSNSIPLKEIENKIRKTVNEEVSEGRILMSDSLLKVVNQCHSLIDYPALYDEYFIKCFIIKVLNEE